MSEFVDYTQVYKGDPLTQELLRLTQCVNDVDTKISGEGGVRFSLYGKTLCYLEPHVARQVRRALTVTEGTEGTEGTECGACDWEDDWALSGVRDAIRGSLADYAVGRILGPVERKIADLKKNKDVQGVLALRRAFDDM